MTATTTTVPFTPTAAHLHQIKFARGATNKLFEGIPADKMCTIPTGCAKNALWVMGHLACTDDWFVAEFGGLKSEIPAEWQKLFGMNSTAVADAKAYPPVDQVRKAFDAAHAKVVKWVSSLSAKDLTKEMPKDWHDYAPTLGDVPGFAAWHEGYHAGQLSTVRKGLGLAAAFG